MDIDERLDLIEWLREKLAPAQSSHEASWIADWICDRKLGDAATRKAAAADVVERRLKHEPLAYILGTWEFCGLEFLVGPGALIPRPETEELVELAVRSVSDESRSLEKMLKRGLRAADLGAGTGCLGLGFLKGFLDGIDGRAGGAAELAAKSELILVEREPAARLWLEKNVERHHASLQGTKVEVFAGSWNEWKGEGYDVILSNPPYIHEEEFHLVDASVKDHEPRTALVYGVDGDAAYREIAEVARRALVPGGWLFFEIGVAQGNWIRGFLESFGGFSNLGLFEDIAGKPRIFSARRL